MSNILTNNINPRSGNKITIGGVNDKVSIAGTLTYEDVSSIDSVGIITANAGIDISNTIVANNDSTIRYDDDTFHVKVDANNVRGSSAFKLDVDDSNAITIDDNRRIGVGTETPAAKLHVYNGDSGATANSGADEIVVERNGDCGISLLTADGNNTTGIFFGNATDAVGAAVRWNHNSDQMQLGPDKSGAHLRLNSGDGVEAVRIASDGKVGIGSDAPSQELNVDGNVMLDGNDQFLYLSNVGTGNNGLYVRGNSQGGSAADYFIRSHTTGFFTWESAGSHRMQLNADGTLIVGASTYSFGNVGARISQVSDSHFTRGGGNVIAMRRNTNDGSLIDFYRDSTLHGNINVSSGTVAISGAHLTRWTQLPGNAERTEILRGTVLSNLDEMCEWGDEDNEQLNRRKVSDVEGDVNVAGVFQNWDDDDDTYLNDYYCAMTGDFVIRIAQGTTVARGDLLMSAGDGTAKPQGDDIVRSKTVAKVTSTTVSTTYSDGSYCVPCVLMAS